MVSIANREHEGGRVSAEKLPSGLYRVPSSSIAGRVYTVSIEDESCTCKGSYLGRHFCRHLQEATRQAGREKGAQPAHFASPDDGFSTFRVERRYDAWMGAVFVVIESRPAGFVDYTASGEVFMPERVASEPFTSYGGAWMRRKTLEGDPV